MSSTDYDVTPAVRSWVRADAPGAPAEILAEVLAAVETMPQRRSRWPAWAGSLFSSPLPVMVAATVVVAVTAVVFSALPPGGVGGPPPSATPSPTPAPASVDLDDPRNIPGLPPDGALFSDPTPGELLLRFEPSTPWMQSWLFADGRLVTWGFDNQPADREAAYIGLVEQRLTPSGVEYLTSAVLASGLLEGDLDLLHEGTGFLTLDVRNGDRMVHLRWGHRTWYGLEDAPFATRAQARVLSELSDLLSSPELWPAGAWSDQTKTPYVPSMYGICVRGVPAQVDPDRVWQLLPAAAQALRGDTFLTPDLSVGGTDRNCSRMTTDDARALARILRDSGIERQLPQYWRGDNTIWVRFAFPDPDVPGSEIWISFCPVLPHGQAIWLGPG